MKYALRAFRVAPAEGEADTGPLQFVASTEGIKRDGLDLSMNQWDLRNFRKNPVVLWAHDYMGKTLPVGRATDLSVDEKTKTLTASIEFDPEDPLAVAIDSKYRRGYLNAVSVGWRTIIPEGKPIREVKQTDITLDLLDISAVPVPGDPDALIKRAMEAVEEFTPSFTRTARSMVGLYLNPPDADEADRRALHSITAGQYQRAGKIAPEYLSLKMVKALTLDQIRGLFSEGEDELVPSLLEEPQQRAGAMLSRANTADIQAAIDLLNGVLQRAAPADQDPPEDPEAEEARRKEAEQTRFLESLKALF